MKKIILAFICVLTLLSGSACGNQHNPDKTFGHLLKGTFYYEPENFEWSTFGGPLVLVPRYVADGIPETADVPTPFVQAGREELGDQLGELNININSYDPELSRILTEQVAAIPRINSAKAFVFDHQVLIGAETRGNHQRVSQQIYQTVQHTVAGKKVHISTDPDLFIRLGDIEHYLNGGYYEFGEND